MGFYYIHGMTPEEEKAIVEKCTETNKAIFELKKDVERLERKVSLEIENKQDHAGCVVYGIGTAVVLYVLSNMYEVLEKILKIVKALN